MSIIKQKDLGGVIRSVERSKIEKEVEELVALLKFEKPELTQSELRGIVSSATRYAKELLKGKAAELYGLSLDWAINILKDPNASVRDKKDVVLKILGHMLPTQVMVTGDESSKPILFAMERPYEQPDISSTSEAEPLPPESGEV